MKTYRRQAIAILVLSALPLAVMAIVNYVVDPFSLFGISPLRPPLFYQTNDDTERQRLHVFGLIYSRIAPDPAYDGILVGSSRTVGMSTERIAEKLKLHKVANLSINGGRGAENRVIAERALETGRIKTVVWEVDFWFIDPRKPADRVPSYLRTRTRLDDVRYLVTPYVLQDSINLLRGRDREHWSDNLDTLGSPMRFFNRSTFEQASARTAQSLKPLPRKTQYARQEWAGKLPRLDEDMISVIRRYPQVRFYLLFPVVPNLLYASSNPEFFAAWLGGRRYLVEQFNRASNVRIFAFDTDGHVAGNLANFFNANHFGRGLDDYLLECFVTGCNELTGANIDAYEKSFIDRVDNFVAQYDTATAVGYDGTSKAPSSMSATIEADTLTR